MCLLLKSFSPLYFSNDNLADQPSHLSISFVAQANVNFPFLLSIIIKKTFVPYLAVPLISSRTQIFFIYTVLMATSYLNWSMQSYKCIRGFGKTHHSRERVYGSATLALCLGVYINLGYYGATQSKDEVMCHFASYYSLRNTFSMQQMSDFKD